MDAREIFGNYCSKQTGRLEGRMFVKIFRQAGLLDSTLTINHLDIIFIKHLSKGKRTLDFNEFQRAMEEVSATLGIDHSSMLSTLAKSGKPIYVGTCTLPVRFYDDKKTYSGVHAHGGPSIK